MAGFCLPVFTIFCIAAVFGPSEIKGGDDVEGFELVQNIITDGTVQFEEKIDASLDLKSLPHNDSAKAVGDKIIETLEPEFKSEAGLIKTLGFTIIIFDWRIHEKGEECEEISEEEKIQTKAWFEKTLKQEVLAAGVVLGFNTSTFNEENESAGEIICYRLMVFATGHELLDFFSRMLKDDIMQMSSTAVTNAINFQREMAQVIFLSTEKHILAKYTDYMLLETTLVESEGVEGSLIANLKKTGIKYPHTDLWEALGNHSITSKFETDKKPWKSISYGLSTWKQNSLAKIIIFFTFDGEEEDTFDFPSTRIMGEHIPRSINPEKRNAAAVIPGQPNNSSPQRGSYRANESDEKSNKEQGNENAEIKYPDGKALTVYTKSGAGQSTATPPSMPPASNNSPTINPSQPDNNIDRNLADMHEKKSPTTLAGPTTVPRLTAPTSRPENINNELKVAASPTSQTNPLQSDEIQQQKSKDNALKAILIETIYDVIRRIRNSKWFHQKQKLYINKALTETQAAPSHSAETTFHNGIAKLYDRNRSVRCLTSSCKAPDQPCEICYMAQFINGTSQHNESYASRILFFQVDKAELEPQKLKKFKGLLKKLLRAETPCYKRNYKDGDRPSREVFNVTRIEVKSMHVITENLEKYMYGGIEFTFA